VKPERAHHCHVCGRCGRKMDHHCPWVANCVGQDNYRHFFLFLFYLTVGCAFVVIITCPTWFYEAPDHLYRHEAPVMFVSLLCSAAFFAVGGLFALHLYLLLSNQTTIEMYFNRTKSREAKKRGMSYTNPYDLGAKRNFEAVFGPCRHWYSFMLPSVARDGFSRRHSHPYPHHHHHHPHHHPQDHQRLLDRKRADDLLDVMEEEDLAHIV